MNSILQTDSNISAKAESKAESKKEVEKKLKHVKVYDQLYAQIKAGLYSVGSQLPSEPELAQQMNVSRMTLRRALSLLQEDNLVENIRGKGNYIKSNQMVQPTSGMESMCHPVKNCCSLSYDKVEIELRLELPTEAILENLKESCAAVVIIDRWYFHHQKAIAYSLTFLPIETVSAQQLNLQDTDSILAFLETKIYDLSNDSILQLTHSNAGNFTAHKYTMSAHDSFEMVHETLYDNVHHILCYSKHYIPSECFHLHIHSTKPRVS